MLGSENLKGRISNPGSGRALTAKDPITFFVPIASLSGISKIGTFFSFEN